MTVLPFCPPHGLTPAEVASLVIFAREQEVSLVTGVTEKGWFYATLDLGSRYELPAGEAVWVISREKGKVVAFDEEDGALLSFMTVADAVIALRRLLPANHSRVG